MEDTLRLLTASFNETDKRLAAYRWSEEMTTVYARRHTIYHYADRERCFISTRPPSSHEEHTQRMLFLCSAPSRFLKSAQRSQDAWHGRTLMYRLVMRDQRCLCPGLDALSFCNVIQLTQTSSNYRTVFSEMTAPVIISTYLLSKCQRWIYTRTRSVILSINISLVRTPIVYHCSEACNCENTLKIEWDNFHSTNLRNSSLHEHHWLMATNLDRLRLWSYSVDWCQWVANLVDVWNSRI